MLQKVEDIHTKENVQTTVLQNLEVRCRRFTEQLQDLTAEIEALRQMMGQKLSSNVVMAAPDGLRERTISEQTELSEDESVLGKYM